MITTVQGTIGECEPFLRNNKSSKLRVFDAILKHRVKLFGAWCLDWSDSYADIVYSIEIEESKLLEFEKDSGGKFEFNPDIQVGREVCRSIKRITYEE